MPRGIEGAKREPVPWNAKLLHKTLSLHPRPVEGEINIVLENVVARARRVDRISQRNTLIGPRVKGRNHHPLDAHLHAAAARKFGEGSDNGCPEAFIP